MMTSQFHINPIILQCVFKKEMRKKANVDLLDVEKKKRGKFLFNVHISGIGNIMYEVSSLCNQGSCLY